MIMRQSEPTDPLNHRFAASRWKPARSLPVLLVLGAVVASSGIGLQLADSDQVIARSFERAFATSAAPRVAASVRRYDGVSGTEDFWLRTGGNEAVVKAVAIGGEITLSGQGSERRMTITSVREVGDAETHIETAASVAPVLLLTCREGDAKTGRDIKLRLEAGRLREEPVGHVQRAL
jgi:hypothetical protein